LLRSTDPIDSELALDRGEVRATITTLRPGIVERRSESTLRSRVECDEGDKSVP
jgi:hypothetical protein